ncbi:MAG: DUF2905 domain-containing protein [Candidatus Omnitrophota bacterium]|nr:DUF2905 domain-containing protein [Candidatus Omnitrophota bacterium]
MPQTIGKYLIVFGLVLIVAGGMFLLAGKLPWLGRLPGDILIKRDNFTFYFPLTTCILASVILSLLFYLFFKR